MSVLSPTAPIATTTHRAAGARRATGLALNAAALLSVALLLRVWRLDNIPGINGDEAWSGVQAARLAAGEAIPWRTPTGNPLNLFFLLPLAALHLVFEPSFALLRSVAVASGLAALAANYLLARRVFDHRTALVSTLLLSLLPIDIAYSRFAWDASQTLLATLLVVYLTLAHYRHGYDTHALPLAGLLALAAAILVHPTNLFAAPLVGVPIAYAWRQTNLNVLRELRLPAKPWVLLCLAAVAGLAAYLGWQAAAAALLRLHGPSELPQFFRNYLGLFSGATAYEYIAGVSAASARLAWLPRVSTLLFATAAAWGAWGMIRRLHGDAQGHDIVLALGWAAMLAGFFFFAGPDAIAPHLERYGMCLVAPGAILLARGWTWWLEPRRRRARAAAWSLSLAAWLLPVTFYLGYFNFIAQTGGESHLTFRTAAVEPKLAALRYVQQHSAGRPARIVASAWWNYWPLAYLASGDERLEVVSGQPWEKEPPAARRPQSEQTWYIEFAGSPQDRANQRGVPTAAKSTGRQLIFDAAGRPLLSIVGPADAAFQNH